MFTCNADGCLPVTRIADVIDIHCDRLGDGVFFKAQRLRMAYGRLPAAV